MPSKGINLRSEQLALLRQMEHKMITDSRLQVLSRRILGHPDYESLNAVQRRNVYLVKKVCDEQSKLPRDLVKMIAKKSALTIDVWERAKAAENFSALRPELSRLVDLKSRMADILMKVKGTSTPYDALLDIYEPKMTSEKISKLFDELKPGLISVMEECQ